MKILRFSLLLIFTGALVYVMQLGVGPLPPLGKFLSPYTGFWKNAEKPLPEMAAKLDIPGLQQPVEVVYDERMVPHIFAQNEHDLFLAQGYITASFRLWQMEFQTHAAAGRVSEIVGEKTLDYDREQRRKGLAFAADRSIQSFETQPETKAVLDAYTEGVNAYINSLSYADYPLEYKLLNYKPEPWSNFKSALLLKYMADMLTGNTYDMANSFNLDKVGQLMFDELFPDYPDTLLEPVVPKGTLYPPASIQLDTATGIIDLKLNPTGNVDTTQGIGSNNWAVHGSRTQTGAPVLCNDPHLGLNLPSLWFEVQLHAPGYQCYGVSLPGAPAVIIGFNDRIAWGVTNGTEDVKDYYKTQISQDGSSYYFDGENKPFEIQEHEIKIKGQKSFIDKIYYTHFGVLPFKGWPEKEKPEDIAVAWTGFEASNELMTFYYLNKAQNYTEYTEALKYFQCPAQNFVFASKEGDVAIWHNGKFPVRYPGQGKTISDGTSSKFQWKEFIPQSENPHVLNPEKGFVSSANQHPTDGTYPYYYSGRFEMFRNRRINDRLRLLDSSVTVEDMMKLQNDNFNLLASEILPTLIQALESATHTPSQKNYLSELKNWNYYNEANLKGPVVFECWWNILESAVWDEFEGGIYPQDFMLLQLVTRYPDHLIFDNKKTDEIENMKDMALKTFVNACAEIDSLDENKLQWAGYKNTTLTHLAKVLKPFNVEGVAIGGNSGIVNACSQNTGPSWRMIVSLESETKAYGIFPGGQSGNPGSHFYINSVDKWAKGEYYSLWMMKDANDASGKVYHRQTLNP